MALKKGRSELYVALARVWREQLAVLTRELPAAIAATDAEALHRFRVALRRTRSLLKLFGPLLPVAGSAVDEFQEGFGWLGEVTGSVRDLDVLLLAARERDEGALRPLIAQLEAARDDALDGLRVALCGPRLRRLLADWSDLVDALPRCKEPPPAAQVALRRLFTVRLLTLALWLLKHGRRVDADTPDTELHRLRIRAKRLRYLIEAFPEQLPGRRGKALGRSLIALQELLGAHQDAAATGARLLPLRDAEAPETAAALDRWLCDLARIRRCSRAGFGDALRRFGNRCDAL